MDLSTCYCRNPRCRYYGRPAQQVACSSPVGNATRDGSCVWNVVMGCFAHGYGLRWDSSVGTGFPQWHPIICRRCFDSRRRA